jgi:hypothetical protein
LEQEKYYSLVTLLIVRQIVLKAATAVPLLYYDYSPVSKFQDHSIKLLPRMDIALRFEATEYKESLYRIYLDKIGDIQNTKHLNKRRRALI